MSSRQPSSSPDGEGPRQGSDSDRRPPPPRRPPSDKGKPPGRSTGKRRRPPPPADPKRRPSERTPRPKSGARPKSDTRSKGDAGSKSSTRSSGRARRPRTASGSERRGPPSKRRPRPPSGSGRVPREQVPAQGSGAEPPTVPFAALEAQAPPSSPAPASNDDVPTRAFAAPGKSRDPLATPSSAILAALDTSAEGATSSHQEQGITAKLGRWIAKTLGVGGEESSEVQHQVVVEVAPGQGEKAEAALKSAGFSVLGRKDAVLRFDCSAERVNAGLRALLDGGLELYGLERTVPDPASAG